MAHAPPPLPPSLPPGVVPGLALSSSSSGQKNVGAICPAVALGRSPTHDLLLVVLPFCPSRCAPWPALDASRYAWRGQRAPIIIREHGRIDTRVSSACLPCTITLASASTAPVHTRRPRLTDRWSRRYGLSCPRSHLHREQSTKETIDITGPL